MSQPGQLRGSSCEGAEGNEAEVTRKWPHGPAGSSLSKQGDKSQDSGRSRGVIEPRMSKRIKPTRRRGLQNQAFFFSPEMSKQTNIRLQEDADQQQNEADPTLKSIVYSLWKLLI